MTSVQFIENISSSGTKFVSCLENPGTDIERLIDRKLAIAVLCLVAIVGLLCLSSLTGWLVLRDVFWLQPGPAFEFLIWVSVFSITIFKPSKIGQHIALGTTVILCLLAVLNLLTFNDIDFGFTNPIITIGDASLNFPGPLLPDQSAGFFMLFVATALCGRRQKSVVTAKVIAAALVLPCLVLLTNHFVGNDSICFAFSCFKISPISSALFAAAASSVILIYPRQGLTAPFFECSTGPLIRNLCLVGIILTPLAALCNWGQHIGLYDQAVDQGLLGISCFVLVALALKNSFDPLPVFEPQNNHKTEIAISPSANSGAAEETGAPEEVSYKLLCLTCGQEFCEALNQCPEDGTELTRLADGLKLGSVFADRYEVISFIAAGGFSRVYKARHIGLDKVVALKLLRFDSFLENLELQRFQLEARATSALSHPNIVAIHDYGVSAFGQPYIVMDYLDGITLQDHLEQTGALSWSEALPILVDICDALIHAHEKGIIHRDLKPANIMLVNDSEVLANRVKIVDFGVAKSLATEPKNLTLIGKTVGSPAYMSPEQCRGGTIDSRSDVYAFGALAYRMLAGQPIAKGETVYEVLRIQISEPPPPLPSNLELPAWLSATMFQSLQKAPEARQQSMAEIAYQLKNGNNFGAMFNW